MGGWKACVFQNRPVSPRSGEVCSRRPPEDVSSHGGLQSVGCVTLSHDCGQPTINKGIADIVTWDLWIQT